MPSWPVISSTRDRPICILYIFSVLEVLYAFDLHGNVSVRRELAKGRGVRGDTIVTTSCYTCSHLLETHLDTVGIRELKTHLSRHLKRVRSGTRYW